jgi:hypothetical protein
MNKARLIITAITIEKLTQNDCQRSLKTGPETLFEK